MPFRDNILLWSNTNLYSAYTFSQWLSKRIPTPGNVSMVSLWFPMAIYTSINVYEVITKDVQLLSWLFHCNFEDLQKFYLRGLVNDIIVVSVLLTIPATYRLRGFHILKRRVIICLYNVYWTGRYCANILNAPFLVSIALLWSK